MPNNELDFDSVINDSSDNTRGESDFVREEKFAEENISMTENQLEDRKAAHREALSSEKKDTLESSQRSLSIRSILSKIKDKVKKFLSGAVGIAAGIGGRVLLGREGYQRELDKQDAKYAQNEIKKANAMHQQNAQDKIRNDLSEKSIPQKETAKQTATIPIERIEKNMKAFYPDFDTKISKDVDKEHEGLYLVSIKKATDRARTDKSKEKEYVAEEQITFCINTEGKPVGDISDSNIIEYINVIEKSINDQRLCDYLQKTVGDSTKTDIQVSRETEKNLYSKDIKIEMQNKESKDVVCVAYVDANKNINLHKGFEDRATAKALLTHAFNQYEIQTKGKDLGLQKENIQKDIEKSLKTKNSAILPGEQDAKISYNGIDYNFHCTETGFLTIHGSIVTPDGNMRSVLSEGPIEMKGVTTDTLADTIRDNVINSVATSIIPTETLKKDSAEEFYEFDNGDGGYDYDPEDVFDYIDIPDDNMTNDYAESFRREATLDMDMGMDNDIPEF